jgi:predicted nuclease of predicted toxin-antitoxin system
VTLVADLFPDSRHVVLEGMESADDRAIWDHASRHDLVVVTKDADFHQRSFLYGAPPRVVWLRVGNGATDEIAALIRGRADDIRRFVADPDAAFLELR